MTANPRLTLAIVTKNRDRYFRRSLTHAIKELEEDYTDAEVIVVDGGSTDGTVDIIHEHEGAISQWVSEPDKNVSDAINKAFRMARGEVIRIIGDDDVLVPNTISRMMKYLDENPKIDILVGHNTVLYEEEDGSTRPYEELPKSRGWITMGRMLRFFYEELFIPECAFIRKSVYERWGGYDLNYHWYAYWEFFCRIVQKGGRIYVHPEQILTSYQTVKSDTRNGWNSPTSWRERLDIARHYGGWRWSYYQKNGRLPIKDTTYKICRGICRKTHLRPRRWLGQVQAVFNYNDK